MATRLWLNIPEVIGASQVDAVVYSIIYPDGVAEVKRIAKPGQFALPQRLGAGQVIWRPAQWLEQGTIVGRKKGEEYLGELHIEYVRKRVENQRDFYS